MLRYPISYQHGPAGSFDMNQQFKTDGTPAAAFARDTVTVDEVQIIPQFRDVREPYHLTQGGSLGRVHKGLKIIRLKGRLIVPKPSMLAALSDLEREFRWSFDPYLCDRDSPSTNGAYAFVFREPTADIVNFPNGRMILVYYARPSDQPTVIERAVDTGVRDYALALIAADPRAYMSVPTTLSLTPAGPSGALANLGTTPAPLQAVITMAGAGASTFTLTRAGVSFVLDLSTMVNSDVVTVRMETAGPWGEGRLILKNGARAAGLKTSGPATWLDVPVGSTTFAISNATNVTSCVLTTRSAWA